MTTRQGGSIKVTKLIEPHGGELTDRLLPEAEAEEIKKEAGDLESWDLTERQMWDIEMILNGGFSPLKGFLNKKDYQGVLDDMRLADGTIWPMPMSFLITSLALIFMALASS